MTFCDAALCHPSGFLDATPLTKVKNAGGNQMQIMSFHWVALFLWLFSH